MPPNRNLICAIGSEPFVAGLLLTGVGNYDESKSPNFFVINNKTNDNEIIEHLTSFMENSRTSMVFVDQTVAQRIPSTISKFIDTVTPCMVVCGEEENI
eukprot:TRINITY_DN9811_c0_g1_i1.p1 TRINITY_DN9811_c0_g1~~TRINITY_DN9811_c0_g1_i1.p1  ORF type:complete len:107 (+),score=26.49 TRINITY_DN9811_c0_g1_i1:27-323(+)